MFVPEIVPKARGTSQHNLKSKTQFKLGFRVLFYVFLVINFKNMQGIHSANKQQLNHTHILIKMHIYLFSEISIQEGTFYIHVMYLLFVPEIVPKARGTSQHNLKRKN